MLLSQGSTLQIKISENFLMGATGKLRWYGMQKKTTLRTAQKKKTEGGGSGHRVGISISSTMAEYAAKGHPQNCPFNLDAFEMGWTGSLGRDLFCTLTAVQLCQPFPTISDESLSKRRSWAEQVAGVQSFPRTHDWRTSRVSVWTPRHK